MRSPDVINVLGVGVSAINMDTALEAIGRAGAEGEGVYLCHGGAWGFGGANGRGFPGILNRAFLCTPDGMPLVWVGRWQGRKEMGRVYGPDLMLAVLELSEKKGLPAFFLRGRERGGEGAAGEGWRAFPKGKSRGLTSRRSGR
jgi:N-acetylglucosaminyldiphosphoundecaprenol N-acetyl-beta-D-mannosaminyltransferase